MTSSLTDSPRSFSFLVPQHPAPPTPTPTTTTNVVPAKRKRSNTASSSRHQHHQHQHQHHRDHPPHSASASIGPTLPHFHTYQTSGLDLSPLGATATGGGSSSDAIHCICGFIHDDGFSIACDDCGRWSHALCFDITKECVPDEWKCWKCVPRSVDREKAAKKQREKVRRDREIAAANLNDGLVGPGVVNGVGPGGLGGVGTASATTGGGRRRTKENRINATVSTPVSATAGPSRLAGPGVIPSVVGEEEHVNIEDDWKTSYVPITEDIVPHTSTRDKLRQHARGWRGVSALSPSPEDPLTKTKVVPIPPSKDDLTASIRPPSYGLQTTLPIPQTELIAPFKSTIVPSGVYLSDPLNAYAHLGMPKPHVHIVPPPLSLALDARTAGNEARFARSGCRPNAVLRPVLCKKTTKTKTSPPRSRSTSVHPDDAPHPQTPSTPHPHPRHIKHTQNNGRHAPPPHATTTDLEDEDNTTLSFAIFALRDLKAKEEVVLGWEWDDSAVVHELPALIESRLGVHGGGPSRMTPRHIARLRLQMQDIVHSLGSTFANCACGSRAKDCAVNLMSSFVDGADEDLPAPNGDVRSHPTPSTPPPPHLPATTTAHNTFATASTSASGTSSSTASPPNRHPTSLAALHELSKQSPLHGHGVDLGPLIGAKRGIRTRVVGGTDGGGMGGVELVHEDTPTGAAATTTTTGAGSEWDTFPVQPATPTPTPKPTTNGRSRKDALTQPAKRKTSLPELRVQEPTPRKSKGKGRARTVDDDSGSGTGAIAGAGASPSVDGRLLGVPLAHESSPPPTASSSSLSAKAGGGGGGGKHVQTQREIWRKGRRRVMSPLAVEAAAAAATAQTTDDGEGGGEGEDGGRTDEDTATATATGIGRMDGVEGAVEERKEERMPPKMRKRWIRKETEAMNLREAAEGNGGDGVGGRNGANGLGAVNAQSASGRGEEVMDVDGPSKLDHLRMPPPPIPASIDPSTITSPLSTTSTTTNHSPYPKFRPLHSSSTSSSSDIQRSISPSVPFSNMSLSAILSPAPSFLQPVPPASMGESAKTSFVAQPQPQPQPQVEGGDVEMSNGVDADADAAEDATPPHKQAIEGRRKSSDAEAGVFVGGREWDADRAMEVDDEHDQQHQHHQQDAEEGEVPSGSVVGERVKGGGRVRFASPAPDAILADVIDVGEETGARHSVSPKVSELPLAPPLTEPIPEPESPSNQHKDGELPLTDSSLPQPPQASASPVILSEPLPPPPEEPPKPPPPPEPPKIRRSMADYIQRKRKQREEEAAKAQASPVVESAALSGAESTASPVVENAPLPGGGEASSASNGGDVEPESSKRSVGENAPPADPSPGDISSAPVQQEQAPSQVQASEPQWSPTSPDTETQSLPYDSGMEDGDGRKDGKDEREYSPSVGNDGSAKSPTPIRDLPTSPLRVPPPERSLERDGRSPSPRPPSRQSSPRQENTTLEAKQEALADDLRLSPRSIYNITTIDLQYIQERSRSEGRTAPQRPPPAESPTPPRRRESTSPTRDRQGEEDGEIPSTTPSLKGTSPSPLLYLARSAYPSRAHTPPTQPRSFHSESGSPPLPYRRPPPPPAQQHFNRPSYSSSQGSQPSSSSRLIPPSGPRALREHQSFGNRGGPHSGSSYIPRGPLADRDRTIDRPDWDRGRPGWQPRGRARGGGGSSWAPR